MADNVTLNAGSGGSTIRTKDRTGTETQVVLLDLNTGGAESLMNGTLPVTQSGSWTVTANAGTGTFAVSAASLPLPTGAATAAKQPALGTAGTASTDVLTIQGIASMTAVKVDGSEVTQPVSGTVSITANSAVNVAQVGGSSIVTGHGTAAGAIRVELPTDGTGVVNAAQSGTWNVGTVTTVTTVATVTAVTAITNALPAGTNLLGQISSSAETGTIYNGTTALTPKFAIITASSSGATTVIAAVTSKKLRVLRWRVSCNGSVNIKWQSHVTPTDVSGLSYGTQYKDCGGGWCPAGHFQTIAGEALDINLSGAVSVSGELTYVEV